MLVRIIVEVLISAVIVWELLIPLFRGLPIFPRFRKQREEKLLGDLEHARQDLVEDDIEEQVRKLREQHDARHPSGEAKERN